MAVKDIRKVAVLGAGVMGTGIAAHLANAGIPSLLLDIVPPNLSDDEKNDPKARTRFATTAIEKAVKTKSQMKAFMHPKFASLVTPGNLEDDFDKLKDVDWVIEVVPENAKIKQDTFKRVEETVGPETIISSNTSGIPIAVMTEGRSEDFMKRFLVTHFFNPVRYMKLLEIVPAPQTDQAVVDTIVKVGEQKLGKGIVYGKDTPNFVANRIGVHSMMSAIHYMLENDWTIKEIDAIVGKPLGRPKTAAFKTADLVGIDTFVHVADNCYESLPDDEDRDVFKVPDFIRTMVEQKLLGDKTKAGFYKKEGKERFVIDPKTVEYQPLGDRASFSSTKEAKDQGSLEKGIEYLAYNSGKVGTLVWDLMKRTLPYSARRIDEIADNVVEIDNGMKWGFNWELGPFETWDAIGLKKSYDKMKAEGVDIPENITKMVEAGNESFYKTDADGNRSYYDFASGEYKPVPVSERELSLPQIKLKKENVVKSNGEASLVDLGDGVLNLEFHSKMNAIGDEMIEMIEQAVETVEGSDDWVGLTVANQASNFSVGANLMLIWMGAQAGQWETIESMVDRLQKSLMRLKYCQKPTVTAPFAFTFGGGCEVAMQGWHCVAAAETYIGLVEVGVGVIPAGGGCKEIVVRNMAHIPEGAEIDPFPFVRKAFETIGMAKVATSAFEAKGHLYLRESDQVVMNKDELVGAAKNAVLGLSKAGFTPGHPVTDMRLPGKDAAATLELGLIQMMDGHYISEHDLLIGKKLAHILTGGDTNVSKTVSEWDLLELEKEAFLSLCGEFKSQQRMQHMLMNNKPLRN